MATTTGTASDAADFYSKLQTFLTVNGWAIPWTSGNDIMLVGPGSGALDSIHIGLSLVVDPVQDWHFIAARGATGVIASATDIGGHVNPQPHTSRIFLDGNPFDYWITENGRRFVIVCRISTVYEAFYAGFYLPYAPPASYPYPLFVGGSAGKQNVERPALTWRSEADNHSHFTFPHYSIYSGQGAESGSWMLDPAGQWLRVGNTPNYGHCVVGPHGGGGSGRSTSDTASSFFNPVGIWEGMTDAYGGDRMLFPMTLMQLTPSLQTYGVLDGVYRVGGVGNVAENLVTVGGVDHLVVQNCFRSEFNDYWALELP